MCNWNTFGARMTHEKTRTHKTHHNPDLQEATTFPLIVYSLSSRGTNTQMSFCLSQLWRPITLCSNLQLRWCLKQSCSPCQELSNGMWQATCKQVNKSDLWLLVVGNQIGNLTPNPSFGHNLCFKYLNGSCEPILRHLSSKIFPMI